MVKIILISLLFAVGFCSEAQAQLKAPEEVKLDAFLSEVEYSSDNPDAVELVFWLPLAFWEVSVAQDETLRQEDYLAIADMVSEYNLFAVVKGNIGYFGGVTYETVDAILKDFSVTYQGSPLTAISQDALSADLKSFANLMQPMMASMLGPLGENMHFIFMESPKGAIDPLGNGDFSFQLGAFQRTID